LADKKAKLVIGRSETVDFPDLGLSEIDAKIDTGAYSTAIHAHKIWIEEIDEKVYLNFELLDPQKEKYRKLTIRTANFYQKNVRSSNGRIEKRYMIKTKMTLGGRRRTTDLSLTNRGKMKYPVLVGRKFLKKGYLVDVSKSYTTSK
tara:strand:+ start:42170 stop:42607 length:438 start_codon:yes stop_codon:yes gene_type:complete